MHLSFVHSSVLAFFSLWIVSADVEAAHEHVLAEAREAITRYYSTIRTVTFTLETRRLNDESRPKSQVYCAIDGDRKVVKTLSVSSDDATSRLVSFRSQCDGTAYRINGFWPAPVLRPEEIIVRPQQPISRAALKRSGVGTVTGFAIGPDNESLADLIQRPEVVVEAQESILGHPCWRLHLGTCSSPPSMTEHGILVWLDPSAGYLMRRISIVPVRFLEMRGDPEAMRGFKPEPGDIPWTWTVADFQEVLDPVFGTRWFPRMMDYSALRAALGRPPAAENSFVNVAFNGPIPKDEFLPPLSPGTRLQTYLPDGTQTTTYHGGEEGREEYLRLFKRLYGSDSDQTPEPDLIAKAQAPPIDARTDSRWSISEWSLLICVLAAMSGCALWMRQRAFMSSN